MIDVFGVREAPLDAETLRAGIDAIFWETTVRLPATDDQRRVFHDLWLGQYLRHEPHLAFVALDRAGPVLGYLVGCFDNPARSPRFSSLSYFQAFAEACDRYPAHLHINLTAAARGRGLGGRLIDRFAAVSTAAGIAGMHVVTGGAARNVSFYRRQGFARIAAIERQGGETVFLGRNLLDA